MVPTMWSPRLAASTSPWNFLEGQIPGPHFGPTESVTAGEAW